ncbi:unnamed protein product [Phyllotreta striolata]|uniref:Uncharacterized protein n=1 Tax=Phyllotreta striolata TaxID=444603 RepID=A0A9N9TL02_PHYSR|nr:unnamed protein product [Phyllotreta striolata]
MDGYLCIKSLFIFLCLFVVDIRATGNSSEALVPPVERELRQGNCESTPNEDLVFQDHIYKPAIPLLVRNATASCHGDYKIYCVTVKPSDQSDPTAEIIVSEGGVNHTFVTIEIHSKRNEGIDYGVRVFAKKLNI